MTDTGKINTTALAFMGDAVFEVHIREHLMIKGVYNADALHRQAVRYVRASAQAAVIKELMRAHLTEDELTVVKRARNRKSCSKPKNADPVEYKLATAFEALIGYLYLEGRNERLEEIMDFAVSYTEERK